MDILGWVICYYGISCSVQCRMHCSLLGLYPVNTHSISAPLDNQKITETDKFPGSKIIHS